jgi:hypothetical protein
MCRIVFPVVCAGLVLAGTSEASAQVFDYQASLGTLPTSQGWTLTQSGSPAAAVVTGGYLKSVTTTNAQTQFWSVSPSTIDFSRGASIEARVRINNSTFYNDGSFKRSGWNLLLSDSAGRFILAGISNASVHLRRDNNTGGTQAAVNMVGNFATVKLSVSGSTATLSLNGSQILTTSVSAAGGTAENQMSFGESSILALSDTDVEWVRAEAVPEPASLLVLGASCLGVALRKRRRANA